MSSPSLNERQRSILSLVALGKTNRQIAEKLHLSLNTIKWYMRGIFQELGANNRVEAVRLAREQGHIPTSSPAVAMQHNLPPATTTFLGREGQIAELRQLLCQPQPRLITICGLGGVGKTRLAVEAVRPLVDHFTDGVYFIPLATAATGEIWETVVSHLQVAPDTVAPGRRLVREFLRDKHVLLILDNVEHLPSFRAEIGWLLAKTYRVKAVVTARERLNLQAEQLFPINGLDYRQGAHSPAFRLFLRSVRRQRPAYAPDPAETAKIIELCALLEGLPLAIELGATWSDVMSPAQVMNHLRQGLRQIAHDSPDRPARHRSLWAAFDYSWQLLGERERQAALCLCPLRGSFSREAALAIGDCSPAVLKRLLNSSLIRQTADDRLAIHQLVRQFLEERAARTGLDLDDLYDGHMTYYLRWLSREGRELRETMRAPIVQRMAAEWSHLESAWWRAVERERNDLLEACIDVVMYFEARGTWGEGQAFFEHTRQAVPASCTRLQARLNEAWSVLAIRMYDLSQGEELARLALKGLSEVETETDEAGYYARVALCTVAHTMRDDTAYTQYVKALAAVTDKHFRSFARIMPLMFAGIDRCRVRDYDGGAHNFREIIAISEKNGYHIPAIRCMLGLSYLGLGSPDEARKQFSLALSRAHKIAVYPALVAATYELDRLDHPQETVSHRRQALDELAEETGSIPTIGRVAIHVGAQYMSFGFFRKGRQLLRIGLKLLWGNVSAREMARNSLIVAKLLAYGLYMNADN